MSYLDKGTRCCIKSYSCRTDPQRCDGSKLCVTCFYFAGAFGLDGSLLTGRTLLNLDTEDWGEIFIGCAGMSWVLHV